MAAPESRVPGPQGQIACILIPFLYSPFCSAGWGRKRGNWLSSASLLQLWTQGLRLATQVSMDSCLPAGLGTPGRDGDGFVFSLVTSCPHSRHCPHRARHTVDVSSLYLSVTFRSAPARPERLGHDPALPGLPGQSWGLMVYEARQHDGAGMRKPRAVKAQRRPN